MREGNIKNKKNKTLAERKTKKLQKLQKKLQKKKRTKKTPSGPRPPALGTNKIAKKNTPSHFWRTCCGESPSQKRSILKAEDDDNGPTRHRVRERSEEH